MNPIVQNTDSTFLFIVVVCLFFLGVVTVAMVYFIWRYSAKKNPKPTEIHGNTPLEVIWTIIPTLLMMMMFFYGYKDFKIMRSVPENAMVVKVTGKMWQWSFEYENKKKLNDTIFVPLGRPIKAELTSVDVLHSFYLRDFRVKEDVVPKKTNYLWFLPDKIGTFTIQCAEYCGLNHSYMYAHLVVLPEAEFYEWLNKDVPDTTKKTLTDTNSVNKKIESVQDTLKKSPSKSGSDSLNTDSTNVNFKSPKTLTPERKEEKK
jgi:cytochrome c oxidase subunit 2